MEMLLALTSAVLSAGAAPSEIWLTPATQPLRPGREAQKTIKVLFKEELSIGVEEGDPNYMFGRPTNVAVDSKGNIYIAEMFDKSVRKYNRSGRYVASIGGIGEGPGEYKMPTLLATAPNDELYVFDYTLMRVSIFRPDGKFDRSFVPGFLAGGMCILPAGQVIVCGLKDKKTVHEFDRKGKLVDSFGDPWDGQTDPKLAGFSFPFAALGQDNCVYLCPVPKPNVIFKANPFSKSVTTVSRNAPDYPPLTGNGRSPSGSMTRGLVVLRDGTIVVAVSVPRSDKKGEATEQLDFYSREGLYLGFSKEIKGRPRCVDGEGNMYVVVAEPVPKVIKYSVVLQGK